jgi:hypothetical protein
MWLQIKAAIAIVGGIWVIFCIPSQTRRIIGGWVAAKFTGNAADYPAYYVKQATRFIWVCVGIGIGCAAMIPTEDRPSDWLPDLAISVIWLVVAAMTYRARRQISAART